MSEHRRALLSLHDVTPFHMERLQRMEVLFQQLGVQRVAYLLIPDYHGRAPADAPAFRDWCRRPRPFQVEWLLHGYYHRDSGPGEGPEMALTVKDRLRRRYATAGEGEFLALADAEMHRRLRAGMDVFERTIGYRPSGFVPPAWLQGHALARALTDAGLQFWESRRSIHHVDGTTVRAPVVTWATRTPLLKWTSVAGTPWLARGWRRTSVLRLAVHPYDIDHPATIRSIRRVWRPVLASRRQSSYAVELEHASRKDGPARARAR